MDKIEKIRKESKERLTFIESSHKYFLDGKPIMGVSHFNDVSCYAAAFKKVMLNIKKIRDNMPFYQERGTCVHAVSEDQEKLYIEHKVLFDDPTHEFNSFFTNYNKFLSFYTNQLSKPRLILQAQELQVFNEEIGIVGTVDRIYKNQAGEWILLDIKTGSVQDGHWLQQLLYAFLLKTKGIIISDIWLLSLKGNMHVSKWSDQPPHSKDIINKEMVKVMKIRNKCDIYYNLS